MNEEEIEKLIDEIIENSNGYSWNFIKTTSTVVEFLSYLKNNNFEEIIVYFSISSKMESIIDEVINWTKMQFDTDENPIYSEDTILKLELIPHIESKFWLIFFRNR